MTIGVFIVLARVVFGFIAVAALALATRHILLNWTMRGKQYLAVFLSCVALDYGFTSYFLLENIISQAPITITFRTVVFLGLQIAAAISGGAFCAFLLGILGQDERQ